MEELRSRFLTLLSKLKVEEKQKEIRELETLAYLSDPYDEGPALVSIHSGQGGVEAMDWAKMLFRMYSRFLKKRGWEQKVIDQTLGEEAGIKSVTVSVEGRFAYGYLKGEAG